MSRFGPEKVPGFVHDFFREPFCSSSFLFAAVQGYKYGIHFASFYLPGDFVPHVRIMNTGCQTASLGNLFGLP